MKVGLGLKVQNVPLIKLIDEERFHSEMQKVQKYIDPDTLKCFPLNVNCAAWQRHLWAGPVPTRWNK